MVAIFNFVGYFFYDGLIDFGLQISEVSTEILHFLIDIYSFVKWHRIQGAQYTQ